MLETEVCRSLGEGGVLDFHNIGANMYLSLNGPNGEFLSE